MKIELKNYRGISHASLELANIALVCGPNGAGKSSIAEAVSAAVTRNAAPLSSLKKKDAGMLLREGEKRGACTVGDDTGSVTANWPGGSITHTDVSPQATAMACGLESLVDMTAVNRAEHLIHYMKALPTEAELRAALPGAPAETVAAVWAIVAEDGWDKAHDLTKERGAKMKGAWEQITSENYGGAKANAWEHPLLQRWADVILEDLHAAATETTAALETAQSNRGTAQFVLDGLKEKIQLGEAAGPFIESLQAEIDETASAVNGQAAANRALPQPETAESYVECPHCKGHLVIVSRSVVRMPGDNSGSDQSKVAADIAAGNKKLDSLQSKLLGLQQSIGVYRSQQSAGTKAAADLAKQPSGTASNEDVVTARQAADQAAEDLRAYTAAHDAQERATDMQSKILANTQILEQLAPAGLRKRVLDKKMAEFNAMLARMCKQAGWAKVALDADLAITFGGRPLVLCSKGEQYRVRAILQLAVADLDGSDLVIFDGADILDRFGRNGLFKILAGAKVKALVCMTIDGKDKVPALGGLGRSYWINESVLEVA